MLLSLLVCLPLLGIVAVSSLAYYRAKISPKLHSPNSTLNRIENSILNKIQNIEMITIKYKYVYVISSPLNNYSYGIYQILIKFLIIILAFCFCSEPIYLDVDSDIDAGEAISSPTENVATTNQEERQPSPGNSSRNNQEVDSENSRLYQGIPKNELTWDEMYKRQTLESEMELYQRQAEHEKRIMDGEVEKIKEAESKNKPEEAEGPLFRHILPQARKNDAKDMLDLTKQLEEIRLKESPTDIGQLSKKRKSE